MSEKKLFPAELRFFCWRGQSALWSQRLAGRNGSADDSTGLFWCRRTAAGNSSRWCREPLQRLDRCILQKGTRPAVWLVQGLFYAALLVVLSVPSGTLTEEPPLLRFAVLILCGSIGGLLGMVTREKKRRS